MLQHEHIDALLLQCINVSLLPEVFHLDATTGIEIHVLLWRYLIDAIRPCFERVVIPLQRKLVEMPLFRLVAHLIVIEYGYAVIRLYQPISMRMPVHIDPALIGGIRRPVLYLCVGENDHVLVTGTGHNSVVYSPEPLGTLDVFLTGHSISEQACVGVIAWIESTEAKSAENNHGAFIEELLQVVGTGVQKHFLCENTETATRHSCGFAANTEFIRIPIHRVFETDQSLIFETIQFRLKTERSFIKFFVSAYDFIY